MVITVTVSLYLVSALSFTVQSISERWHTHIGFCLIITSSNISLRQ